MVEVNEMDGCDGSMVRSQAGDRGVLGLYPGRATSELWQFRLPNFASVFRNRDRKSVVPFYLVSTPGEVKDPGQPHMG